MSGRGGNRGGGRGGRSGSGGNRGRSGGNRRNGQRQSDRDRRGEIRERKNANGKKKSEVQIAREQIRAMRKILWERIRFYEEEAIRLRKNWKWMNDE